MKPKHGPVSMTKWEQKSTNIYVYKGPGVELIVRRKSKFSFHYETRIFGYAVAWSEAMDLDRAKEQAQEQLDTWLILRLSESRGVHMIDLFDAIKDDEE